MHPVRFVFFRRLPGEGSNGSGILAGVTISRPLLHDFRLKRGPFVRLRPWARTADVT
jgi:hypothetical protein